MPEPIPNPADVPALVAVLELEAAAAQALASAGLPPDLTRPPTAVEVKSRTAYAALEREVLRTTADVARIALTARARALAFVQAQVAGAADVAGVLARLDDLAAGMALLDGARDLVTSVQAEAYARLVEGASTAMKRFRVDAAAAGITPGSGLLSQSTLASLDAQARRLAVEAVATAVRATRGAAYTTPRRLPLAEYRGRVAAAAADVGTKGLEDVAHQTALRAHGGGRMDAVAEVAPRRTVALYASELLDRQTCAPCAQVDGTTMTEAEAADLYPDGQYVGCLGGPRCRGTVVAVDEGETPSVLAVPGDEA